MNCLLEIGYRQYLLEIEAAVVIVELLENATIVKNNYTTGAQTIDTEADDNLKCAIKHVNNCFLKEIDAKEIDERNSDDSSRKDLFIAPPPKEPPAVLSEDDLPF